MNADELELSLEELSRDVGSLRETGPLSFQDVQKVLSSLTRAQLVLNELLRVELQELDVGNETAERFVALEQRIRTMRDGLYRELQCRTTSSQKAGGLNARREGEHP